MTSTRLDLWLHTARFFKTRALAAAAIEAGRVELNGQRTKRGRTVKPGDQLRIRLGPYEHWITIEGLAPRRGPASQAATLYREDPESVARRMHLAEQHRLAAQLAGGQPKGRPTKRDRRELQKLKQREPGTVNGQRQQPSTRESARWAVPVDR